MTDSAPTTKVTLPSGKVLELKSIVTGYDQEAIDAEYSKVDDSLPATQRANRKSFEVLVVSVDGATDEVVDRVLKLEIMDYRATIKAINNITDGIDDKKKETSAESTVDTPNLDAPTDQIV